MPWEIVVTINTVVMVATEIMAQDTVVMMIQGIAVTVAMVATTLL
jgi:hypothetical protein